MLGTVTGSDPEGTTLKVCDTCPCPFITSTRAESAWALQTKVIELLPATLVAEALNDRICGASGVLVATGVLVAVDVLVGTGVLVTVLVAVKVNVGVSVKVDVTVTVDVREGVNVAVGVTVGVLVAVLVAVGTGVWVGVLLGVRLGSTARVGSTAISSCGWQAASSKKARPNRMAQNFFETIIPLREPR